MTCHMRIAHCCMATLFAIVHTATSVGEDGVVGEAGDAEVHVLSETAISPDDRAHWSFQPIARPDPPKLRDLSWARNKIDAFICEKLEAARISPSQEADRRTLIRRLSFDLTGLPPSPGQVERFINDTDPEAYSRLVNMLLASPDYGVRWAQHWLDLARFAETDGFEHDKVRDDAWKYRDWVIDALNDDMPYDEFIRMQVSGDEVNPDDELALVATYFCVAGPDMPDINLVEERRHNLLNEMTSTVGEVVLAMQVGCAQCHDHMYDPISQADFYRFRSFFEGSVQLEKNHSVKHLAELTRRPPPSFLMIRGDFRRKGPLLEPAYLRVANYWDEPVRATLPNGRSSGRRSALVDWLVDPRNPLTARVIVNRVWQFHFGKGISRTPSDFGTMGLEPSHPELLDWLASEFVANDWSLKHLHRLILNSSTFRQASNARGVRDGQSDAENHGSARGEAEWQARREADPRNILMSRFPQIRIDGETIRDAMLAISGSINMRMRGPSVRPPLPDELKSTLLRLQWEVSKEQSEHYRRSVYIFVRRNLRYPIFEAFDRPDANASCARRSKSTTAPQSLLMLNSEFSLEMSRRLAGRILTRSSRKEDWVEHCVAETLGREPSSEERTSLLEFLERQSELLRDRAGANELMALPIPMAEATDPTEAAALTDLCLAIFNSNEFIYID